jgi:DNA-binding MarR family transcriptional regulator
LAKRLKIGYSSIHVVLKHFTQMGVIVVGRGYAAPITLAPWFAAPELEAVLCKIEGWPCPKNTARNDVAPHNIDRLFGGRSRSRLLMLLACLGPLSLRDLARLIGVTHASATHAARHLHAERIIELRAEGGSIMASLDPTFAAADELRTLLQVMASRTMDVATVRHLHHEMVRQRAEHPRRTDTPALAERLLPFGQPEQSKLLLEIGRRTACTISELAEALRYTHSQVRGVMQSLQRHRLVISITVGSARKRKRWIALDPRHPLHDALRSFSQAAGGKPVALKATPPGGFPPIGPRYAIGEVPVCLPGDEVPNNMLIALARRRFEASERDLGRDVGQPRRRIRKWLRAFHGAGLVTYSPGAGGMRVELNRALPAYAQVRRVLEAASEFLALHGGNGQHHCFSRGRTARD